MFLTTREKVILETLVKNKAGNTLDYFSSLLKVSRRTVQRDFKTVSHTLALFHLSLSKRDQEFYIAGTNANLFKLAQELHQSEAFDQTPEEKNWQLLKTLAHQTAPYKLSNLASEIGVSTQTASTYLESLSDWLQPLNVTIERYRGSGIQLQASERNKRQALASYLLQYFDEQLIDALFEIERDTATADWFDYLPIALIKEINTIERSYLQASHYEMAVNSYLRFLIQLAIALQRSAAGFLIDDEPITLRLSDDAYRFAATFTTESSRAISKREETEMAVLWQSAIQLNETMGGYDSLLITRLVQQLIAHVSEQLNIDLTADFSLFQGLLAHMPSAVFRFQNKITVHNPLSEDIRRQYPLLFMAIEKGLQEELNGHRLAIDEMAYIVLHFGSALEMRKEQIDIETLIICPTGFGASKMLSTRLTKDIPELTHHVVASMAEMQTVDWDQYDIVLSTVRLQHPPKTYLLVNPLLPQQDVHAVRRYIKEQLPIMMERKKYSATRDNDYAVVTQPFAQFISELDAILKAVHSLLDNLKVTTITAQQDYRQLVADMITAITPDLLTAQQTVIFEKVRWREKQGGLAIPNTTMALFHTRHAAVQQMTLTIVQTAQTYALQGMDAKPWPVSTFILLLAPEHLSAAETEVVSTISALLIESTESTQIFSSGQERLIRPQIERALQKVIVNKTQRTDLE